jgi:hypothetical protein
MTRPSVRVLAMLVAFAVPAVPVIGRAATLGLTSQALTPSRTCTITATPSSTTAVADASVRQASATSTFGTSTTNNVATATGANRRLYVRFDLSVCSPVIPSTAVIRLATLRLFVTGLPASCRTIDVFRVTTAWTEAALTWNNQPFGTAINNPAASAASDTFFAGTPTGCQNATTGVYLTGANPTADVAAFVAGTASNLGWMLRDDVEGSSTAFTQTTSAKDLGTLAQAPQLVVTYVLVP